jgi:zinc/manganese transport system permease protein
MALLFAGLGERARADDVTVGVAFAWILGLGVLFLDLFNAGAGGGSGIIGARALFGSIFGLSGGQALLAAAIAVVLIAAALTIARPLLFASLDPAVAIARGVPAGMLGTIFLVLVGADAAEATQAVGALLLLGLLAAPAGAAHRLTASPYRGMALSAALALASVWIGIAISYRSAALPPSSAIVLVAGGIYLLAFAVGSRPLAGVLRWMR